MKGIRSLEQRARGGPCYVDLSSHHSGDISHPKRNRTGNRGHRPRKAAVPAALRSGRELSDAAHAAMRHWAKATDQEADAAARELLGIYREIQQDTRMARSQRETLRLTVRARLDQLCTQISKRIAKDKAAAKAERRREVGRGGQESARQARSWPRLECRRAVGRVGGAAAGQNANADNGQQLVDLIQNTICPRVGTSMAATARFTIGSSSMRSSFAPPATFTDEISDTLEQLNRATH